MNRKLLEEAIKNSGLKKEFLASKLEISRQGFYDKLLGKYNFTDSEIITLSDILYLSNSETREIFMKGDNENV